MKVSYRITAVLVLAVSAFVVLYTGSSYKSMYKDDVIVPGPSVKEVKMLSDYFEGLKDTAGDTEVYVLEGEEPGGTLLFLGGTHPNEPAGFMTAVLFIENAVVEKGRIIIIPQADKSGFTANDPQEASPQRFSFTTAGGNRRTFRYGARATNPLDQWPDPDIYVNPSNQTLSGSETRNLNRCYPGRPDGTLTEKIAYGIMEVIRKENALVSIDLHEASPEYPVINAMVAHEKSIDLASIAVLELELEGIKIRLEKSPPTFYGLSHRSWGDYSDTWPILMETANPSQGRLRSKTNEALVLTGKDPWYVKAQKLGKLYVPFDENGHPIEERVGRHSSSVQAIIRAMEYFFEPEQMITVSNVPGFDELMANGFGNYLNEPAK
ncbi:MAG TPA: succinylglutamate desuccinylase/aspartoacylase family protein [Bacillota bacterium]|nr:succinylglutamate desuccinylase/aspartoacylase family protein [Bacillota bacterium]HOH09394.1 succinylglutamate desuccinylase/aspartoacylase family protein [Bacillota bacterium]HPI01025.1 succinylglutamate desuccinylase/aspartoacylase family protein [Bacillota bacterium]HPM64422.1 succinylglutamate desuccinylase/aspartoacylase family protein [Bacillota bacterium]HQJ24255.1 succinylglutamate desuccinylase/aspartoacylase family protein [Bacillota bacterium]